MDSGRIIRYGRPNSQMKITLAKWAQKNFDPLHIDTLQA
jgi:hypothetical protein